VKHEFDAGDQAFLAEATPEYLSALVAISEYRERIIARCREAVSERLPELQDAIGIQLRAGDLKDWINPKALDKGGWPDTRILAWLAVRLELEGFGESYYGLTWGYRSSGDLAIDLNVTFAASRSPLFSKAWGKFKAIGGTSVVNLYGSEIAITQPLSADQVGALPQNLVQVIDKWVEIWKQVGGIQGLLAP
jgi:hypothetical protein